MHINIHMCIYICIDIDRNRTPRPVDLAAQRHSFCGICIHMCIYIYIYIHIYTYIYTYTCIYLYVYR